MLGTLLMVTVPLTDVTQSELEAFFEEIFVMKNFSHPNIVGFPWSLPGL